MNEDLLEDSVDDDTLSAIYFATDEEIQQAYDFSHNRANHLLAYPPHPIMDRFKDLIDGKFQSYESGIICPNTPEGCYGHTM